MAAGSERKVPWVMGLGVGTSLGPKGVLQEGDTHWGVRTPDCHRGPVQGVGGGEQENSLILALKLDS